MHSWRPRRSTRAKVSDEPLRTPCLTGVDRGRPGLPLAREPKAAHVVQTDYCVVEFRAFDKAEHKFFWAQGYGPCSQQDHFFNT